MVINRISPADQFEETLSNIEEQNGHKPTSYQIDIYEEISRGSGHLIVNAVAGSGKTTTILDCLKFIPSFQRVLFVAFNKHIAEEINSRGLPKNASARTLHSLGLSTFPNRPKINEYKCLNIFEEKFEGSRVHFGPIKKTISLLRNFGFGAHLPPPEDPDIDEIVDRFGIEIPQLDFEFNPFIQELLIDVAEDENVIDFDDMLYIPVRNDHNFHKFDFVFVDESQDLNPIQIEIVKRLMTPNSRAIFVGDRHQAIYGFRGADPDAMKKIEEIFQPKQLPLSICWRCAERIVKKAQHIIPEIEPAPHAPAGDVYSVGWEDFPKKVSEGDYVLCRTTAPLVQHCLELIRQGTSACVKGRDIGKGLTALLNQIEAGWLKSFPQGITLYGSEKANSLKQIKNSNGRIASLLDRIETLEVLAEGAEDYDEVRERIEDIFSDSDRSVTFSTIHKAKGLEAHRIFILRPDLLPHPRATLDWEREQERNLSYVAITRAKTELVYVFGGEVH